MPRGVYENHASGKQSGRWNGGKIISSHGYPRIRVGKDHPLADPNGYCYEHTIVWVSAGNPVPQKNETLHHISGDKTDNRIENLKLMTKAEHNALHNAERGRNSKGQFNKKKAAGSLLDGVAWKQFPKGA